LKEVERKWFVGRERQCAWAAVHMTGAVTAIHRAESGGDRRLVYKCLCMATTLTYFERRRQRLEQPGTALQASSFKPYIKVVKKQKKPKVALV
jgi:hypothetical protein